MGDLLARFKDHLVTLGISDGSIRNYLSDLNHFQNWLTSSYPKQSITEINSEHPLAYRTYLMHELEAPVSSVNRRLSSLRQFFTWAVSQNLLPTHPMQGLSNISIRAGNTEITPQQAQPVAIPAPAAVVAAESVTQSKKPRKFPVKAAVIALLTLVVLTLASLNAPNFLSGGVITEILTVFRTPPSETTLDPETTSVQEITQNKRLDTLDKSSQELSFDQQRLQQGQQSTRDFAINTQGELENFDSTTENALQNSSYELNPFGPPEKWQYFNFSSASNTIVTQDGAHTGVNVLKFSLGGIKYGGLTQSQSKTRSDSASALSVWVRGSGLSWNGLVKLGFKDDTGKYAAFQDFYLGGSFGWQRLTVSANGQGLYPAVEFRGYSTGSAYLDDWQMTGGRNQIKYAENKSSGQGSVETTGKAEITPVLGGSGSLGTSLNRFGALYLSGATIDTLGNVSISGTTTSKAIKPLVDKTYDLGTSTLYYRTVYAQSVIADGSTISGNQTILGNLSVSGTSTLLGLLTSSGGIITNNASINTGTGPISGGSIAGATLTTTGNTSIGGDLTVSGATTLNGLTTLNANFIQTGATTFSTGTGAVSLNGDVTIAAGKNLSLASGAGLFSQTFSGTTTNAHAIAGSALTTGNLFDLSNTSAAATSSDLIQGDHTATYTTAQTVSGQLIDLSRALTINAAATTLTVSGAVATISDNCIQTAGTCTNTANILSLTQSYSSATGAVLNISNSGSGADILFNTTPILRMADGGTLVIDDGTNTLISIADQGTNANITVSGDAAVNGGDLTSSATTFNLLNSTVTTLNIGGAATTINLGATSGTTTTANSLTILGNTTLGDTAADTITLTGAVNSNILPDANNTRNLGSSSLRWNTVYGTTGDFTSIVGTVTGGSTTSSSWAVNSDNATANAEIGSLAFETGTAAFNDVLQWNASGDAVRVTGFDNTNLFNFPIGIYSQVSGGNQSFTSGTLFKYGQPAVHAITQSAAFIGTDYDFSSNITVPNSASGNQTGFKTTLKDGGASATAIGFQTAGTLDYGIDLGGTIGTAEIRLSNGETITNTTDGTVSILGADLAVTAGKGLDVASTGALGVGNTTATTVNIGNTAGTTLTLGSGGALTRTISIGTGTGADTINIGTGTVTADTISIGGLSTTTISTTGTLTHTGTANINSSGSATTALGNSTGSLTLASGGTSSWTNTSGNLTIQTATSGTLVLDSIGALNIGNTNATSLSIGRTGVTTTNNGALTSTQTLTASNGFTLTTGALNLTGTSGSIALTGYGTTSITSTTASGNILTLADSSFTTTGANLANFTFTNTNSGAGAVTTSGLSITPTGTAITGGGSNTLNAVNLPNVTPIASNTFNGINFGTGYNNLINSANFTVTAAGAVTAVGVNSGTGLIQGTGGLTITGTVSLPNDSITAAFIQQGTAGQLLLSNATPDTAWTTLSGDATLAGTGALTLASTGVTAASYGGSTAIPVLTVDAKGRVTAASTASISSAWSSITNPTTNLALTMAANTSTLTYNAATGTGNLFTLTDTASNTGTGYLFSANTASLSTLLPFRVQARGNTIIDTTATGGVTIGNSTSAQDVNFFSTSNKITSAGALTLAGGITASGNLIFGTDNSFDIGASGATRPRSGYFGTSLVDPLLIGGSGTTQTLTLRSTSGVGAAGADIIFQTGNNGATEAMRILNSGNVGIGTTAPSTKLDIFGTQQSAISSIQQSVANNVLAISYSRNVGTFQNPGLVWYATNNNPTKPKGGIWLQDAEGGSTMFFGTSGSYVTGITNTALAIDQSGNVGIGTTSPGAQLDLSTDSARKLTTTTWSTGSDIRFKTDVQSITDGLATIEKMRPVKYRYNADFLSAHPSVKDTDYYNFIAQEYQQVFPDSVTETDDRLYLNPQNMIPYAIAGIKELDQRTKGIGTASPQAALDVRSQVNIGGIGAQGTLKLYASSASGTGASGFISMDNTTLGRMTISAGGGSASTENSLAISASTLPGIDNTYGLGTTSLRWGSLRVGTSDSSFAGSVGIGTTGPAEKLEVENGNILLDRSNLKLTPELPPGTPTVAIGSATGITGTYNYQVTFVTASGETEGGTVSSNVTVSNQKVDLSAIPTGTTGFVTARKIYRSTTGPITPRKLVTTISDNTTTTYTDSTADGSLGANLSNINTTASIRVTNAENLYLVPGTGKAVVFGDGTGKITAGTFDPVYKIEGINYSTYAPSMLGVKEEITGSVTLIYDPANNNYSHTIDLANQPQGSDLWVFSRISDPDVNMTAVLVSANFSSRVWYLKDAARRSITIFSDRGGEVSYRLTAPRFDHLSWGTLSEDQSTNGLTPPASAPVGGESGSLSVNSYFGAFSENFNTTGTVTAGDLLVVDPTSSGGKLMRSNGAYDAKLTGVATSDGPIATVTSAGRVQVKVSVENGNITPGDHLASSATKPGLAMKATQAGRTIGVALQPLIGSDGTILVSVTPSWFDPAAPIYNPNGTVAPASSSTTATYDTLTATTANITNLNVGGVAIVTDSSGNLKVNGNVIVTGKGTFAEVRVNGLLTLIGSISAPNGLAVNLGLSKAFEIKNAVGDTVAQISDEGVLITKSAQVSELKVSTGSAQPTTGTTIFRAGGTSMLIETAKITSTSKVVVTFKGDYAPATRYWTSDEVTGASFTLHLDQAPTSDVSFNWWIVN